MAESCESPGARADAGAERAEHARQLREEARRIREDAKRRLASARHRLLHPPPRPSDDADRADTTVCHGAD
ncbi:hypothetical protein tb265_07020 [Gemmatimonadetes bacterium T265]|nr:hypothetical protein tb265_07020 [Gemmatimonadetes bacterium T265]